MCKQFMKVMIDGDTSVLRHLLRDPSRAIAMRASLAAFDMARANRAFVQRARHIIAQYDPEDIYRSAQEAATLYRWSRNIIARFESAAL